MKYAQIIDEKVYWIGEYSFVPHFAPEAGIFVDITDNPLDIQTGWPYTNGGVHPQEIPVPPEEVTEDTPA